MCEKSESYLGILESIKNTKYDTKMYGTGVIIFIHIKESHRNSFKVIS